MEKAQPLSEHRLAIDAVIAISYWALNPRSRSQWSIVIMKFGLDFQSHQLNYWCSAEGMSMHLSVYTYQFQPFRAKQMHVFEVYSQAKFFVNCNKSQVEKLCNP